MTNLFSQLLLVKTEVKDKEMCRGEDINSELTAESVHEHRLGQRMESKPNVFALLFPSLNASGGEQQNKRTKTCA